MDFDLLISKCDSRQINYPSGIQGKILYYTKVTKLDKVAPLITDPKPTNSTT